MDHNPNQPAPEPTVIIAVDEGQDFAFRPDGHRWGKTTLDDLSRVVAEMRRRCENR